MLLTSGASTQLKAIVWAGNPRHSSGEPFNYGSCTAGGVNTSIKFEDMHIDVD